MRKTPPFLISILLTIILVVTPVCTYASVDDNVGNSKLEILVGEPDSVSSDTLFGLLHQILTVVSTLATAQQVEAISTKIDGFDSQLRDISATMKNTQAVMGGGCYYTIYTDRPYLLGYKLTLTDGTMAKSCYVQRDEDSGKYTGVLSVSLGGTITIKVIDPTTKIEQCRVTTPASSNSYATINLDTLLTPKYADILNVNDTLATSLYKDSFFTNSGTYTPTVCNYLAQHQEHFQDFLQSCAGISIASQNFDQLYGNEAEFLRVVGSSAGKWLLANGTFGPYVANSRSLLRSISFNKAAYTMCNNTAEFCKYLMNTSLPKCTQIAPGGSRNMLSGNLLCISVTSGSRGGQANIRELICSHWWAGEGNATYYETIYCSHHYQTYLYKDANSFCAMTSNSTSGCLVSYSGRVNHGGQYEDYSGTDTNGNTSVSGANQSVGVGKFVDKIDIVAYGDSTYSATYQRSCSDSLTKSCSTNQSTANSVITYIDLDAAD